MNKIDKVWRRKLEKSLKENDENELFEKIADLDNKESFEWNQEVFSQMKESLSEDEIKSVLFGCSCHKPKNDISFIKKDYNENRDIAKTHKLLEEYFFKQLENNENYDQEDIELIKEKKWGLAGKLEDNKIKITKIPKNFKDYFKAIEFDKRRASYCHCKRLKELIISNELPSKEYCYCGAGYYKDLWEYILGRKVTIEIDKSILEGNSVCSFIINLNKN